MSSRSTYSILYIIPYPKFFSQNKGVGGHIAHAHGIISALRDNGCRVDVVTEEDHEIFHHPDDKVYTVPLQSKSKIARQLWHFKLVRRVAGQTRHQDYDFCYIRYSAGFSPWLPTLKKKIGNTPLVMEVNSLASHWGYRINVLEKRALRAADLLVCISDELKNYISSQLDSDLESRCVVIPNGVDPGRFESAWTDTSKREVIKFGFVGYLLEQNGVNLLIEAHQKAKKENQQIELHIFGEGPFRKQLEGMAEGDTSIKIHQPVPFLKMPETYRELDILLYATTRRLQFQSPTKLFEYLATAKPVITADTPPIRQLIGESEALFYQLEDSDQLAGHMLKLAGDPDLRKELANNGYQMVKKNYTWQHRISVLLDEFDKLR